MPLNSLERRELGLESQNSYLAAKRSVKYLEKTATLQGHHGCVNTLAWNATGELLLSGSDDCRLNLWKVDKPHPLVGSLASGHISNIFGARFLDQNHLVSCAADGRVIYSDITRAELADGFTKLDLSTESHHFLPPFKCHGDSLVFEVMESDSPNIFYSCASDGTVNRYDLRVASSCNCSGCTRHTIIDVNIGAGSDSSKIQHSLASTAPEPQIPFETDDSPFSRSFVLRQLFRRTDWDAEFGIASMDTDPTRPWLMLTGSDDDYIRIWDLRYTPPAGSWNMEMMNQSPRQRGQVYFFSPDFKKIAPNRPRPRSSGYHKITSCCFDPSGSGDVLVSYASQDIYLIRPTFDGPKEDDIVQVYKGAKNEATMIKESTFFPPRSGEFIMSGSDGGKFWIWDKESSQLEALLVGDGSVVNCVAPHPLNGTPLAASGIDHTIKIFSPTADNPNDPQVPQESSEDEGSDISDDDVITIPASVMLRLIQSFNQSQNHA